MKHSVLVLNLDFSPFDIWDWQHSISKYLCTNSVNAIYDTEGIVKHDKIIKDGRGNEYELPAVLILNEYVKTNSKKAQYTKMNVYARDMLICQFCGKLTTKDRTVDHIIPRSRWNSRRYKFRLSSFENVVTACESCNKLKRNRTPQQAGMKLIRKPRSISRVQAYSNKLAMMPNKPVQWIPYLKEINVQKTT